MNRDNTILWVLGIVMGVVTFLMGTTPPTEWGYHEWLQAIGGLVALVSAKMGNSPLKGKDD